MRAWLLLSVPGALVCAVVLGVAVARLVQLLRAGELLSVPLAAEQLVTLPEAGELVLHGEGPRLSRRFAGLEFELRPADGGAPVPLQPILFKTTSSGWSTARVSLRSFALPAPGRYLLRVAGLAPDSDVAGHRLVFARANAAALVLWIVAIVLAGIGLVGGTVASILLAVMKP